MSRVKNKFDDIPSKAFFQGYTNNSISKTSYMRAKAQREQEVYKVAKEYLNKIDAEREEARQKAIADYAANGGNIQKRKYMKQLMVEMTAAAIKIQNAYRDHLKNTENIQQEIVLAKLQYSSKMYDLSTTANNLLFTGPRAEWAAKKIQHKYVNYRTWKKLHEVFEMVKLARLKRQVIQMCFISRVWKRNSARRYIAHERFIKFRTVRLKQISKNLKRLAFQEFWKRKRTNFWIIREKDRRQRRYNKARSQTRGTRYGRHAKKAATMKNDRKSLDPNASFDNKSRQSTTVDNLPSLSTAQTVTDNMPVLQGMDKHESLVVPPQNVAQPYQEFTEGMSPLLPPSEHSHKSNSEAEAEESDSEAKSDKPDKLKDYIVPIPEEKEPEEIKIAIPPRKIQGNAAQEVKLKDPKPFKRRPQIVKQLPMIPDWAMYPMEKEETSYDITRTTFNRVNPFGVPSRLNEITQNQLMRGKEMLFQRWNPMDRTRGARPMSQGSIGTMGMFSEAPSTGPYRRPDTQPIENMPYMASTKSALRRTLGDMTPSEPSQSQSARSHRRGRWAIGHQRNNIMNNTISSEIKHHKKRPMTQQSKWTPSLRSNREKYVPDLNNTQFRPTRFRPGRLPRSVDISITSASPRYPPSKQEPKEEKQLVDMSIVNPYRGSFSNCVPIFIDYQNESHFSGLSTLNNSNALD